MRVPWRFRDATLAGLWRRPSVAVDRLVGVAALLTLAVFGLVLGMPDADSELARIVAGVSMGGALLAFGVLWADDLLGLVLPGRVRRTPVGTWLSVAAGEMARYRTRRGAIGVVFVLSLVVQWLRVTEVFLLGAGLGLDIGFGYYLVFMPVGLVAMMLPISRSRASGCRRVSSCGSCSPLASATRKLSPCRRSL